ncbi:hypothetical protein SAV14893_025820 [Streptomyces avermitilis]|uniref:Uncharacterized protein n=1 Tax=Streptomyces avermitilis TaxID=33903 RepID=A0A4D4LYR0_STRAX|nr:hypothetical protein SAV14893_025820 [Streptomyces avermitilis]
MWGGVSGVAGAVAASGYEIKGGLFLRAWCFRAGGIAARRPGDDGRRTVMTYDVREWEDGAQLSTASASISMRRPAGRPTYTVVRAAGGAVRPCSSK